MYIRIRASYLLEHRQEGLVDIRIRASYLLEHRQEGLVYIRIRASYLLEHRQEGLVDGVRPAHVQPPAVERQRPASGSQHGPRGREGGGGGCMC